MKRLSKITNGRLVDIKEKANNEAKSLMKAIADQSKLTPYDECINPRLKDFKDKAFIKESCFELYGESKSSKCSEKKEFCGMCCHFHIGSKFYNKQRECEKKCDNLINGRDIEEGLDKNLKKEKRKNKSEDLF